MTCGLMDRPKKKPLDQRSLRIATSLFQAYLQAHIQQQVNTAVLKVEALLDTDQTRKARGYVQRWYRHTNAHPQPPTREVLENISDKIKDRYIQSPPE